MCQICGNPYFDFRYTNGELPEYIQNDITRIPLRPGLQVNVRNHPAYPGLTEKWEVHSRTFMIDFVAGGEYACRLNRQTRHTDKKPGLTSICYIPGQTQTVVYQSHQPVKWLGILVDQTVMQELFADGRHHPIKSFERLLQSDAKDAAWCTTTQSTPRMQILIDELYTCPYRGNLAGLFWESKILELLYLKLSLQLAAPIQADRSLTNRDEEKLRYARKLLLDSPADPPNMHALARKISMSETRLKRGFRKMFGIPVYAYLREHRMQNAYELLRSGQCNSSQAALHVGYQSFSHFSQAFRKRFGICPSSVAKRADR